MKNDKETTNISNVVAHTCNPNYMESKDGRITVGIQLSQKLQ
jgi:hypothetical protein